MEIVSPVPEFWNESNRNESLDTNALLVKLNNKAALLFLPVTLFMAFLMVIGIVGNVIVFIVYLKRQRKFTPDLYIFNLAILDLLTCTFGIPMEITDLCLPYIFYAPAACKIVRTLESWTAVASALTLVIISIDRYKRICKYGESFSISTVKILCLVAMCGGAFFSWPLLIIVGKRTVDLGIPGIKGVECSVSDLMQQSLIPLVYYVVMTLCFVGSLVFVIFVYVRICSFLKKTKATRLKNIKNSSISSQQPTATSQSIDSENKHQHAARTLSRNSKQTSCVKVTRTTTIFVAVTVVFIVSFLPFLVTMLLRHITSDMYAHLPKPVQIIYLFCSKTYFINNSINPVIYSFLSRKFREDVKRLFVNNCNKNSQTLHRTFSSSEKKSS